MRDPLLHGRQLLDNDWRQALRGLIKLPNSFVSGS